MVNVKLGDKTYEGVTAVKTDTTDGGTAEFAPYDETFAAGKAEGIEEGYANGKTDGYAEGKEVGIDEGIKTEYDRFWDAYQQNGSRTDYLYGFAGTGWTNEAFVPKYPIVVVGNASYMFSGCMLTDFDFVEKGVSIDFSGMTLPTYLFRDCLGIKRIGVFDCSGCKELNRTFSACRAQTIDLFVVNENITFTSTFEYARALENIKVSGVIGKNISFEYSSELSAASVQSVIDHLKDLTGATAQTLTFHANVGGNMTTEQKAAITSKNWTLVY